MNEDKKADLRVVKSYLASIAKKQKLSQEQATNKAVIQALLDLEERVASLEQKYAT